MISPPALASSRPSSAVRAALLVGAALSLGAGPEPARLRAVTFNAAGIPLVHPLLAVRMAAAGDALRAGGYDVVGLQELWFDKDSAALALAAGLPHRARAGRRFVFGTGLTILSRWPIVSTVERAFSVVRPTLRHPTRGEFIAGKGFLMARIATPWGELDAYDVHVLADYPRVSYRLLRATELFELAEGIRELSAGRPFVVMGDFNCGAGDWEYEMFRELLGLEDLCSAGGDGCSDPRRPKRIDHVLVPRGASARLERVLEERLTAFSLVPLSDHSGFAATLTAGALKLRAKPDPRKRTAALKSLDEAIAGGIERLERDIKRARWIPLYGQLLGLRYKLQIGRLAAIRQKIAGSY